jgi:hypothetical protein
MPSHPREKNIICGSYCSVFHDTDVASVQRPNEMAVVLEIRAQFLDYCLVEEALTLPRHTLGNDTQGPQLKGNRLRDADFLFFAFLIAIAIAIAVRMSSVFPNIIEHDHRMYQFLIAVNIFD